MPTEDNHALLEDLFQAYYDARRHKRNSISALAFEVNYEKNLLQLYREILARTYRPSPYSAFIVEKPVKREIFASDFRDRVVHHLLFNYLNPLFEPTFINDSYSCRTGKGTSYGIRRAGYFLRSCTQNYTEDAYVLKIDIKGYFMSIDRTILYDMIQRVLARGKRKLACELSLVLFLLEKVLFFDPTRGCVFKSPRAAWRGLPRSKSLFYAPRNKGLPIGNLTSQLFANIYLSGLDQHVKRTLGVRYYGRYVDDMILVSRSKARLQTLMNEIQLYMAENVALQLHPKKIYLQESRRGVMFLGMTIKPYRVLVGKRIRSNLMNELYGGMSRYNDIAEGGDGTLLAAFAEVFSHRINSYLGLLRQADSYNMRRKVCGMAVLHCRGKVLAADGFTKIISRQGPNCSSKAQGADFRVL